MKREQIDRDPNQPGSSAMVRDWMITQLPGHQNGRWSLEWCEIQQQPGLDRCRSFQLYALMYDTCASVL